MIDKDLSVVVQRCWFSSQQFFKITSLSIKFIMTNGFAEAHQESSTAIRKMMREERYKKNHYLLRTIPGVGPPTATSILVEIGDVKRFQAFVVFLCRTIVVKGLEGCN